MKKTRFTESQILKALKEADGGRSVSEISRELGVNPQTFYNWKKKYLGMIEEQLKRLKELEDENRRLKQLYADAALDNKMLKDVIKKKWYRLVSKKYDSLPGRDLQRKYHQSMQDHRPVEVCLLLPFTNTNIVRL